jgi:ribosomal protein S12
LIEKESNSNTAAISRNSKTRKVKRTKSTFNNDNSKQPQQHSSQLNNTDRGMMIIYEKPKAKKKSPKVATRKLANSTLLNQDTLNWMDVEANRIKQ